jgi:hypothetical protein
VAARRVGNGRGDQEGSYEAVQEQLKQRGGSPEGRAAHPVERPPGPLHRSAKAPRIGVVLDLMGDSP